MSEQTKNSSVDQKEMKRRLVMAIVQFFNQELEKNELSVDSKDSLEVVVQCLTSAYDLDLIGCDEKIPSLLELFSKHAPADEVQPTKVVTEEEKAQAISLKEKGNQFMAAQKFQEAWEAYTEAIRLDPTNPIYFCNRAAAHNKLNNHLAVLEDCKQALKINPNYSKAYYRMGLAYTNLNELEKARNCYKRAFELDPNESSFRDGLRLAEQKLEEQNQNKGFAGLSGLLNNPKFLEVAQTLVTDPNMVNIFSQVMSGAMGGENPESAAPTGAPGANNSGNPLDAFLQLGQSFAQRMREANPELVEQLKNNMTGGADDLNKDKTDDKSGQN